MVDESSFADIGRNPKNCYAIYRVRIKYNMPVLTERNRFKFLLLALAERHPESKIGQLIKSRQYEDRTFFDELEGLTSIATLERDNREMERRGWFTREKEEKKEEKKEKPLQTLETEVSKKN